MLNQCRALLLLCALAITPNLFAQDFYLHNGDRVVFYGDSITAQRYYTRDIQDFVATRYPDLHVSFHNAGVPGDKVTGGYAGDVSTRVKRDVTPWNPTVITAMLGMNDGDYMSPDPKVLSDYETGYKHLLALLRSSAPDAKITLLENTPYDEITHGTQFAGYMATTEQNAKASQSIAAQEHLPIVDTFSPVYQLLQCAKDTNVSFASLLVTDRIHPAEPTHWIIAAATMKAWGVNPVVSTVKLSAASDTATTDRTKVTAITGSGKSLEWDQQDEALPLPLDFDNALASFVVSVSDVLAVDQETLQVTGLQTGTFKLRIDSTDIGTFTSNELSNGINLAAMETPMWQQARHYDGYLEQRSALERADLTLLADSTVPDKSVAGKILREGEAESNGRAEKELRIPKHHYLLTCVSDPGSPAARSK